MQGLFITGTDTGVGKTWVGSRITAELWRRGVRVRPRKPAESGCPLLDGVLLPQDAAAYQAAVGGTEPLERICRFRFAPALSPERAAALAGQSLTLADLVAACQEGVQTGDYLVVEGAGGFYSPIAADGLNADLAMALDLPVLLVSVDRLGAIHQTLVTAEAIARRGLTLAGVVLDRVSEPLDPLLDNAEDLRRWLGREVWVVGHGGDVKPLTRLTDKLMAGLVGP